MNRRKFLAVFSVAGTVASFQGPLGVPRVDALQPDPIRRQFLEARAKAQFWLGLGQLAEPLPYLHRAWELGTPCATVEEKAQILEQLRDCEVRLELSREFARCHANLLSDDLSTLKWYWLVGRDLQKIGSHREAIQVFSRALHNFPEMDLNEKGLFVAARAFSLYCLGDHRRVLREVREAIAKIADGETAVTPLLLECEILSLCALGSAGPAGRAAREYVSRFGRLAAPHRYALWGIGLEPDSIFLTIHGEV